MRQDRDARSRPEGPTDRFRDLALRTAAPAVALGMIGLGTVLVLAGGGGSQDERPRDGPRPRLGGPGALSVPIGGEPLDIAVGEGSVWVVRRDDDRDVLVEVDPETRAVGGRPVELPRSETEEVRDLAVGEGAVWVLVLPPEEGDDTETGSILRLDASTGATVDEFEVPATVVDLAVGQGSLWIGDGADGSLSRLDPETGETLASLDVGESPGDITVARNGVWVTTGETEPEAVRVTLDGEEELARFPGLSGVRLGRRHMWALGPGGEHGAVVRIDPAMNEVVGDAFPVAGPQATVTTIWGMVWVGAWFEEGTGGGEYRLLRLDTRTNLAVTEPVVVDHQPTRPQAGEGGLWVASNAVRGVLRVDPAAIPLLEPEE